MNTKQLFTLWVDIGIAVGMLLAQLDIVGLLTMGVALTLRGDTNRDKLNEHLS